jgi:nicotinate dehydrogenase subunit A
VPRVRQDRTGVGSGLMSADLQVAAEHEPAATTVELQTFTLRINGATREVRARPGTPLLYILRNDLSLKGAKFACGLEQCMACAVIADGVAVPTCASGVDSFVGKEIRTVEGIGRAGDLDPVQQAFIEERAAQCGYCTAGMIVGARALLDRNPDPSDEEITEALEQHVCRCGTHPRVRRAIHRAAAA